MEEKIRELAAKYQIPESFLKEAIQLEKEKVVYQNRRMVPILVQMVERYAESLNSLVEDGDYGD